ncbi:hypothetical protein [Actinomadura rubteroloni]|uniref:hypothetical protein n=1 Tax=Actinomadura rubteroloni TaxID=1926885 RepID=UPI0011B0D50C|nr:hypothetical protein [Actinomadura rubteroloni]
MAFAQCMRHNGVPNFPEPKGDAPIAVRATDRIDVRSAAFRKAQKACSPLLPGGSGPQASKAARTAAQKYARCMREHGVKDFPDPMGDGGLVIGSRSKIDPEGGPYQDAKAACDSALR